MTEQEFWVFLKGLWKRGRANQVTMTSDSADLYVQPAGEYIGGHAFLPRDYDKISPLDIIEMGSLLFKKEVKRETKEAIIILLAHQSSEIALTILTRYNLSPDKGLEFFAKMALDECVMWNE